MAGKQWEFCKLLGRAGGRIRVLEKRTDMEMYREMVIEEVDEDNPWAESGERVYREE